ncbi:TonB-dependent receptor plug domain-containing protein [Nannocystaceae bacterium ST9]
MVLGLALGLACPTFALAAPPEPEAAASGQLRGRLRVAGQRAPLAAVKVLVVEAPADVDPGRPAREPLDPATVTWIREAETDEDGRFAIADLPVGKVRVVVVVAGYARLEQWAEVVADDDPDELELFAEPENPAGFRTEVVSRRPTHEAQPERVIDAERARVYPGSGSDPLRAAQNLPGMARAPAGLGLIAIRGGDPTQTGIYLDGHPIPRAFHVLPIASVLSPGTTDRVELNAGNYDAAYGGHSAGMIHVHSKSAISGPLAGVGPRAIHGEAHVDLFDFGGTINAPVGQGGVTFGFRRGHVGNVIKAVNQVLAGQGSSIWVPNYWDYFGRFDHPIGKGQMLTLRAIGAGDTIQDQTEVADGPAGDQLLDFASSFHRFDGAWSITRERLRVSISPALRLDNSRLDQLYNRIHRDAVVFSLRASLAYDLTKFATLIFGLDLVRERWRRDIDSFVRTSPELDPVQIVDDHAEGRDLALGLWWGADFHFATPLGALVVRPQARLGVFSDGRRTVAMLDPRIDMRWRVHERLELVAAIGQYAAPIVRDTAAAQVGLLQPVISTGTAIIDIPQYLVRYFDPDIEGELRRGALLITRTIQASTGLGVELPWQLRLQATAWWRETLPEQHYFELDDDSNSPGTYVKIESPRRRAYGLELMLDRPLARDIHGWVGYSLLRSQEKLSVGEGSTWQPAVFDQRHNLVVLISAGLPHNFRIGLRFRVVSGNPESAVIGAETVQTPYGTAYRPIRTAFGESYRPVFHQLDVRIDKTWIAKRASVSAYFDVQNVYNRWYPEVYVYSADWRERSQIIGLPIFPSLGVRVDY